MSVQGCKRVHKGVQGCTRVYKGVQGCTRVYKVEQGCTRVNRGVYRIYIVTHSSIWVSQQQQQHRVRLG